MKYIGALTIRIGSVGGSFKGFLNGFYKGYYKGLGLRGLIIIRIGLGGPLHYEKAPT